MSKFNIGDRVRVTETEHWDKDVDLRVGDTGTVIGVNPSDEDHNIRVDFGNIDDYWPMDEDKLELVNENTDSPIELTYNITLAGKSHELTHKQMKELKTLVNGVIA